jgi:predicted DNA-binding protein (UPF0251 family)
VKTEDFYSWSDEVADLDNRLQFFQIEHLDVMNQSRLAQYTPEQGSKESCQRYLKKLPIDLENAKLTDKQMIAVSLVFYGNIPKSRAARAMKITYQSLNDHISGALKKIERSLSS